MTVGLVGSGLAAEAVEAALDSVAEVERVEADELDDDHRLGVVVSRTGAPALEKAHVQALEHGLPWFAIEIGGIGGYPVVDAAVTGFGPDAGCYECLRERVGSNADSDAEPNPALPNTTVQFAGAVGGYRAARFLVDRDASLLGSIVELPHVEREFLPVPGCECGGERDRVLDRGHLDRSLDSSLERAERALDDRVGIIKEVGEAESYPAPYYLARLCDTSGFSDAGATRQAAGVDPGWDAAFMKALGESFERYCAGVYHDGEFTTGAVDDVDDAVAPSAFVTPEGFGDAEDGGEDALDGADRAWVRGEVLETGKPARLPAELVHYPPPEVSIRPAITTGLGLGNSTVEAALAGLYEVLERDAATIAWYSTYEPLELVVDDAEYEELAARAGAEGLDVTALLLTQDVDVPVVAVVLERDEWPSFAVATAAHLDPADAARDALAEAIQNWLELRGMGRENADDASGAIGEYAETPPDRFTRGDSRVPAATVGLDDVPTGVDHLDAVLERVSDAGLTAYAARTTTPDVQSIGFESLRVVAPTAQPLFFDDPYFGERAERVPAELGFEPALDRDHHPYP